MRDEFQPPPDVQLQIDAAVERMALYRSDEMLRDATAMRAESPNPDGAYEAMRRIRDASDTLQRVKSDVDYMLTPELSALLLEMLAGGHMTEEATRRLLLHLKDY